VGAGADHHGDQQSERGQEQAIDADSKQRALA
jgi:hypothetical protein